MIKIRQNIRMPAPVETYTKLVNTKIIYEHFRNISPQTAYVIDELNR